MDTTTAEALERLTMNHTVSTTVAGDLATKWRRIAVVIIVQPVEVATHLRMLTDPRRLPIRRRLFRRIRVLVVRNHVLVVRNHVEVQSSDKDIECLFENRLNHLNHMI
jgi:ribose 1,5-bisphosphokinase PhnN